MAWVCPKHRNPSYISCWLNHLSMEEHPLSGHASAAGHWDPSTRHVGIMNHHTEFFAPCLRCFKVRFLRFAAPEGELNHGQSWQTSPGSEAVKTVKNKHTEEWGFASWWSSFPSCSTDSRQIMSSLYLPCWVVTSKLGTIQSKWTWKALTLNSAMKLHNYPTKTELTNFFICPDILFYHFMW